MPTLLKQYDKCIVTDVDVVFLDDISKDFLQFSVDEKYYLAGVQTIGNSKNSTFISSVKKEYKQLFTEEEIKLLDMGAGYYIFNCALLRKDFMKDKFIRFAEENCERVMQPEQDTINIVCGKKKKKLHPRAMVCTYVYDIYKNENDYTNDINYNAKIVKESLEHPIQLHYATYRKPWNFICQKQNIWFEYLSKTNFFEQYMEQFMSKNKKKILFTMEVGKRKFMLTKEHV